MLDYTSCVCTFSGTFAFRNDIFNFLIIFLAFAILEAECFFFRHQIAFSCMTEQQVKMLHVVQQYNGCFPNMIAAAY